MIGSNCFLVFSLNYLCQSTEEMGISILKMGPLTFEVVSVSKQQFTTGHSFCLCLVGVSSHRIFCIISIISAFVIMNGI